LWSVSFNSLFPDVYLAGANYYYRNNMLRGCLYHRPHCQRYATGRYADTGGLQLEKAGVVADGRGKFETVDERTNVPHVYAVGDVLAGKLELTPVAIKAGEMLARRLFKAGYTRSMDYEMIATTVFTPSEYGSVGLSEEAAVAKHGADHIESYLWQWTTLEHQAVHRIKHRSVRVDQFDDMPKNCMAKLVCLREGDQKVVGFHYLGPSAGELTQGFALAVKVGCTKADFDDCVGIHPTDAEAFCSLEVKRSGIKTEEDWTASGGCGGGKCG
jgi:thioredoxin reductase (NADPH)